MQEKLSRRRKIMKYSLMVTCYVGVRENSYKATISVRCSELEMGREIQPTMGEYVLCICLDRDKKLLNKKTS